jgi:hypothetical protein
MFHFFVVKKTYLSDVDIWFKKSLLEQLDTFAAKSKTEFFNKKNKRLCNKVSQIVLFTNYVFWFCFFSTDLLQFKDLVFRVFILKLLCFVLFCFALFERNNNNNHLPEPCSVFWHLIENPFFLSLSVSLSVSLL